MNGRPQRPPGLSGNMAGRLLVPVLLTLLTGSGVGVLLPGCGYHAGWLMEERAPGARTIAVTIPGNLTYRRDLEIQLARELSRTVLESSPWILAEPEVADLLLEGEITAVQERVLSENRNDDTFESSITITVVFRFVDQRSGNLLREFTVSDRAEFLVGRGETVSSAQQEAFVDLVDKVVFALEDDF